MKLGIAITILASLAAFGGFMLLERATTGPDWPAHLVRAR